jgi:hypothetical protein
MIRKILFLVIVLTIANKSEAQTEVWRKPDIKIGINGGGAWLFQNDLRKINRDTRNMLPFATQTINDFPPYFTYGGQIVVQLSGRLAIGTSYQYYTTGSRIGARDYSATYSFDQIISSHSPGLVAEIALARNPSYSAFFELTGGLNLASWKMEEKLVAGEEKDSDQRKMSALRPFIYPGFKVVYPLSKSLGVFFKAGYSADLGGKYSLDSYPGGKIDKWASFSGIRAMIGLDYIYQNL